MPATTNDATRKASGTVSTCPIEVVPSASTTSPTTMTGRGPKRSMRVPPSGANAKPSSPIQANTQPTVAVSIPRT